MSGKMTKSQDSQDTSFVLISTHSIILVITLPLVPSSLLVIFLIYTEPLKFLSAEVDTEMGPLTFLVLAYIGIKYWSNTFISYHFPIITPGLVFLYKYSGIQIQIIFISPLNSHSHCVYLAHTVFVHIHTHTGSRVETGDFR